MEGLEIGTKNKKKKNLMTEKKRKNVGTQHDLLRVDKHVKQHVDQIEQDVNNEKLLQFVQIKILIK